MLRLDKGAGGPEVPTSLRFALAAADAGEDGEVTLEELDATPIDVRLYDPSGFDASTLGTFVTALARTVGHFRGEGVHVGRDGSGRAAVRAGPRDAGPPRAQAFRPAPIGARVAFAVVAKVREEEPELFDAALIAEVHAMLDEAIGCEAQFAEKSAQAGVAGLSLRDVRTYLEFWADQRLATLGMPKRYGARNPLSFMALQDVQEVTNFFQRRVSAYQVGVSGDVVLDATF